MNNISLREVVNATKGEAFNINYEAIINGVSTDTRKISEGNLFIALIGENFDGHNFIKAAINGGAKAAIVSRVVEGDFPQILVTDTAKALRALSRYYKSKFDMPVIAVTGSTGKTSTKEMIASVLGQKFNVHKTQKNFNNEIGLPLSMFEMENYHNISVLEMGMNHFNEIKDLVEIANPNIGVITNIGTAHIENLGSKENIFKAKMEITTFFNSDSVLIVNGDDSYLGTLNGEAYKIVKVSLKGKGDYNAIDVKNNGEEGTEFKCIYKGNEVVFKTSVPGTHNVYNALVAIAIGEIYNLNVEDIKRGILEFSPGKLRMEIINLEDIKIINDCYNANVDSMKAAIEVLNGFKGRKIAVLGDMFELGVFSQEAHSEVGNYLAGKCDLFLAVGNDAKYIYENAVKTTKGYYCSTKEEACRVLMDAVKEGDNILIKASRGMRMEEITEFLTQDRKRGF